ncbi:MAG: hypothetical protein HPY83_10940 [Anaerolineae bacterium]|nr:hypothetical protein [Anaerolineae bacterium]
MLPLSDVLAALRWLLVLEVVGLAGLPLARRLFIHLPGASFALARPLGLLAASYGLWLLSALGFLRVEATAFAFCLALVFALGWAMGGRLRPQPGEVQPAVIAEALFVGAFVLAVLTRSYMPEIEGTEKPMEFAFLNALLRDGSVPPHDPWLAGYAISYYYFGYLMMAALARLSDVAPAVAFNLGIASLFALTLAGAFAVVRGMVAHHHRRSPVGRVPVSFGLLGSVALTVMGNLEGFLEVIHSRGLLPASFWRWLDIKDLLEAPQPGPWLPDRYLWWWRASRVINDRSPLGEPIEVIDEFPFFSFLLGDMHPHVLALPFAALAAALCVEWTLRLRREPVPRAHEAFLGMAAVSLGALGFLNTWDWPIYLALFAAATWIGLPHSGRRGRITVAVAVGMGLGGLLAYLPFYLSFQSQASGIVPNFLGHTHLHQYLVMLGPLYFVAAAYAGWHLWHHGRAALRPAGLWWAALFATPYLFLLAVGLGLLALPAGRQVLSQLRGMEQLRQLVGNEPWGQVLARSLVTRLGSPWMLLAVSGVMAAALARLIRRPGDNSPGEDQQAAALGPLSPTAALSLAMMALALGLTWAVEFVYLRDYFGTRMNTVFKFYYQAWVLLSLGCSYAAYCLWNQWRGWARLTFAVPALALLLMALVYPPLSLWTRADGFSGSPTLDGTAHLARHRPAEYEAIAWLQANVRGTSVIAEAPGGSYTAFGRVSANTGLPTILGWDFHEMQWRGTSRFSERQADVERLYTARSWEEAKAVLDRYSVAYVYVGPLERQAYGPEAGALLAQRLPAVFESTAPGDPVLIVRVPGVTIER